MDIDYNITNSEGEIINVSVIGFFKVEALNKEYVMYSIMDNNEESKYASVLIAEAIRENDSLKIVDIVDEERKLVTSLYNEISKQLGE